jgi:hypothetical protein
MYNKKKKERKKSNFFQWNVPEGHLITRWCDDINPEKPLPEYPRPQLRRDLWLNLNGIWDYAIRPKEKTVDTYDGKILVPFPIESILSGVNKKLKPSQVLWYRRSFFLPKEWNTEKKSILIHFGAVDWQATVWVNNKKIGNHRGGYTPFTFEISEYIKCEHSNEVVVKVCDPTDEGEQERGKQALKPNEIWYTAVSGIWQTVWLEPVPKIYIKHIQIKPNIDKELLNISITLNNPAKDLIIQAEVIEKGEPLISTECKQKEITLKIPSPKLWSPKKPFLYDLKIALKNNQEIIDKIESYFGMRKISLGNEINGIKSIELNNEKIFQYGILDQGYWPDGLYTAPTDEALRYDIEIAKDFGFNMIRKHVKVEPARWYYYCDKLGLLVWQDMPNGGGKYKWDLPPTINEYKDTRGEKSKNQFYNEFKAMINTLRNFPSIIIWVAFNEGWGQFDTGKVANFVKTLDSSRVLDAASGWYDYKLGDICDIHSYPNPIMPQEENVKLRAPVIGEFGGLGLEIEEHMWDKENKFVYRKLRNREKLMKRYKKLITKLSELLEQGLCAAIYTQLTDVEGEVNGLLTYDREILKMDKKFLQEINRSIC